MWNKSAWTPSHSVSETLTSLNSLDMVSSEVQQDTVQFSPWSSGTEEPAADERADEI